jgi:hypothetical protein
VDASSFKVAFIVLGFILSLSAFGFYKLNSNSNKEIL